MKSAVNKGTRKLGVISIEHAGTNQYNDNLALLKGNNKVDYFNSYVLVVRIKPNASSSANVILPLVPKYEGDNMVVFNLDEPTTQLGVNMCTSIPELASFIAMFNNQKFQITAANLLAPTVLTLSYANNAADAVRFVVR